MKTWPLFSASSGAAYPTAGHHSRASSQVSGPLHQSILMLRLRAGIQTRSISSKVRRITTVLLCRVFFCCCCCFTYDVIHTGRRVWAFSGYTPKRGYPKKLTTFGLPRSVRKIDAALNDVQSGKILLFSGDYYYRYVRQFNISPLRLHKQVD